MIKKRIVVLILLFGLLAISSISASDITNDTSDLVSMGSDCEVSGMSNNDALEIASVNQTNIGEEILSSSNYNRGDSVNIIAPKNINMLYHDGTRFFATLVDKNNNSIANAHLNVKINGVTYERITDNKGNVGVALNLDSGTHTITTEYTYGSYLKTAKTTVVINPTVQGNDLTKMYRNASQYYATFVDSWNDVLEGVEVEFNINGVLYKRITNEKGTARLNINLGQGTYIITSQNPVTGEKTSNTIKVLSVLTQNHDLVKYYKNASQYSVKLLDNVGSALANKDVTFNINGVFYTRQTNENGIAKLNINLGAGNYIITADYNGCKVSNTINVLAILSASDLSMIYKDGSKFKVKLVNSQGNICANENLVFNINGVFYTRTSGSNGIASLNINLNPGDYVITSTFNGFSISNTIHVDGNGYDPSSTPSQYSAILNIDNSGKTVTNYFGHYKASATLTQSSDTLLNVVLSNNILSGTGKYANINRNYYTSSIYSDITGKWEWSDWKCGGAYTKDSSGNWHYTVKYTNSKFHKYTYSTEDFTIAKIAIKIIDGLSEDGYSFYPTCSAMPDVDSHGITREYAIKHNMHYLVGDTFATSGYMAPDVNGLYHF